MTSEKSITSRNNPLLKRIREAIREHGEEIVIEGPKAIADAISSGWKPVSILVTDTCDDRTLTDPALPIVRAPHALIESVSDTRSSQGAVALFERPRHRVTDILERSGTIAIALDAVQDPGNVGTIVRLAAAFDAAGVLLLPGCADPYGPKAVRSSVGAILGVPVAQIGVEELLAAGRPIYAASMSGDAIDPPAHGAILLFGNEGRGVSAALLAGSQQIAVPMSPRVESLNVAMSAAILLARSFSLRLPAAGAPHAGASGRPGANN